MRSSFASVLVVLGIAASLAVSAGAQNGPKIPFQATFEHTQAGTVTRQTTYSDGRGHMRSEYTGQNGTVTASIMDFPAKCMYSINDPLKTVMKMPLDSKWRTDDDYMTKMKAQKLAPRVIDGHPCTGWQYNTDGHVTQIWTGTDTDCTVLMTTDNAPTMRLKTFARTNPPAQLFAVPAGYKVQDMSAFMQQMKSGSFNYTGGQGAGGAGVPDMSKYRPPTASNSDD